MKRLFLTFFLFSTVFYGWTQQTVSIGTTETNPNAILWLKSAGQNQGLIIPIVTTVTAINTSDQDKGMIVYSLEDNNLHFRDGNGWKTVGSGTGGGSQTLTINGNVITLSGGSSIDIGAVAPASGQPGQVLMWNGSAWTSSSVTLPQAGQVLKWNATTNSWTAQADDTGTGTLPAMSVNQIVSNNGTGNIAVSLVGDITLDASTGNMNVKNDAINNDKLADNAVTSDKIADGSITTSDIQDAAITGDDIEESTINTSKIAPSSATEGQVLKFVGGTWSAAADDTGTGTLPAMSQNQIVSNNGSSNIAVTVGGDLTLDAAAGEFNIAPGVVDNSKLATDAVGSSNIQDGTITNADIAAGTIGNSSLATDAVLSANILNGTIAEADIANGAIGYGKIGTTGATDGDVLTFNQTSGAWEPAAPTGGGGGTYTEGTGINIDGSNVVSVDVGTAASQIPQLDGTGKLTATVLPTGVDTNSSDDLTSATTAGGDLSGTFSNLQLAANTVTAAEIANDAVGATEITADAVTNSEIAPNTITGAELSTSIAITTSGAVSTTGNLSATGANVTLNPGTTLTLRGATWPASPNTTAGFFLQNNGTGGLSWAAAAGGTDVTGQTGVLVGNAGAITGKTATGGGQIFRRNVANSDFEFVTLSATDITTGTLALANGGTGATTAANARTNLGLGSLATLSAIGSTEITDGQISNADVAAAAAIAGTKVSPAFGGQNISTTGTGSLTIGGVTSLGNTLSVTGAATFANTLGVTGNATLGGTLGVTGITTLSNLAGTGTRMVVASNTGVLSTQSLPNTFTTDNVIPKGSATGLIASQISDNGNSVAIVNNNAAAALIINNNDPTGFGLDVNQRSIFRAGVSGGLIDEAAMHVGNLNSGTPLPLAGTSGGVFASTSSSAENKIALQGLADGPTGSKIGFYGRGSGDVANYGMAGEGIGSGFNVGVYGYATDGTQNKGATLSAYGIDGALNFGVQAEAGTSSGTASENIGGQFSASGVSVRNIGIYASASGGTTNWAGLFDGNITFNDANDGIVFPAVGGANLPMITMFESGTGNADRMVISHSSLFSNFGLQYQDASDKFHWLSSGVPVMTMDLGTQRVGVNQTGPLYPLDVGGQVNATQYSVSGLTMIRGTALSTFIGNGAGGTSTTNFNTIVGANAGAALTTGLSNTFMGEEAGEANLTGSQNAFFGLRAGEANTDGINNTFIGRSSGDNNTTGSNNVALGYFADVSATLSNAIAIGANSSVTQSNSMVLGNNVSVGIGTSAPTVKLDVTGTQNVGDLTSGIVNIGNSAGNHVTLDNNELQAKNDQIESTLFLNYYGGDVWIASTGTTTSVRGNLSVSGSLSKGSGSFKIDHPLDPTNKYLYHSFVESPDMMNIYNGNVVTDANGDATVELPEYFSTLNKDFRYQLTPIGQFAQVIIAEEVNEASNTFKIKSDKPNVKISWQITGVRQDPYANKNRIVPEVDKTGDEKGTYLHPEAYGQPGNAGQTNQEQQ